MVFKTIGDKEKPAILVFLCKLGSDLVTAVCLWQAV